MDLMSIIGMIGALGLVVWGTFQGGTLKNFWDPGSVAITIGGTFMSLMITFPLKVFAGLPKMFKKVFFPQKFLPYTYIEQIVEISNEARKASIVALEDKIPEYKDDFLKKGLMLAVDAVDPEEIREIMESELAFMMERHKQGLSFFEKGAALAPGFGMIGTLVGLVNMLMSMGEGDGGTDTLMSNMAVALITTFYGSMLANVFFLPMGNKLKQRSDEEVLCKQIIIEGVIAIVGGENPKKTQERLLSFIPPKMRTPGTRKSSKSDSEE